MSDDSLMPSNERRRCLLALAALPIYGLPSASSASMHDVEHALVDRAELDDVSSDDRIGHAMTSAATSTSTKQSLYVPLLWSNGRIPIEHDARPLIDHPYVIERDNGQRIAARTDANGWTQAMTADGFEWVTVHITLPS